MEISNDEEPDLPTAWVIDSLYAQWHSLSLSLASAGEGDYAGLAMLWQRALKYSLVLCRFGKVRLPPLIPCCGTLLGGVGADVKMEKGGVIKALERSMLGF